MKIFQNFKSFYIMNLIEEYKFKHPFTCLIAGPTKSGKTTLLKKILTNYEQMISHPIDRIVYCYSRWQDALTILKNLFQLTYYSWSYLIIESTL